MSRKPKWRWESARKLGRGQKSERGGGDKGTLNNLNSCHFEYNKIIADLVVFTAIDIFHLLVNSSQDNPNKCTVINLSCFICSTCLCINSNFC